MADAIGAGIGDAACSRRHATDRAAVTQRETTDHAPPGGVYHCRKRTVADAPSVTVMQQRLNAQRI